MAAKTGTYTLIASNTIVTATNSITFSSVPSTYTDLLIAYSAKLTSGNVDMMMRLNSDTGSNYSSTFLWGTGSAAGSTRYTNATSMETDYYGAIQSTSFNVGIVHLMDYANTTTYKTGLTRSNAAEQGVDATVGLWRSTAAINAITLFANGGVATFIAGSTFKLYGIEAAK